jgi:zinc protease
MTSPRTLAPVVFEQYTLSNGLTVILHPDDSTPVAAVVVMYSVGSKDERSGKTGLAHLFEHLMFKGSANVADGEHFRLLQELGANVNGTTSEDRTNYYEVVPPTALELALYLEGDRMGHLLDALSQEKLDNQRDVVKNERRQHYDNQPYGTAHERIKAALFPAGHPYSWPVIGSMDDLTSATLQDVHEFFRAYYAPNNACLAIAGRFRPDEVRGWIERYFGSIPPGTRPPMQRPDQFAVASTLRIVHAEQVQLPRLYLAWPSAPMHTHDDALLDLLTTILSAGKSSRLHNSLLHDQAIAQSVTAYQQGDQLAGMAGIQATARPGIRLSTLEASIRNEITRILQDGVTQHELEGALNYTETHLVCRRSAALNTANGLATCHALLDHAGAMNEELSRFNDITAEAVQNAARLFAGPCVALSIVPTGHDNLAADGAA